MASAIIVVVIFVLLALAILFICQNGGWQGGCGGNCASCHQHCCMAARFMVLGSALAEDGGELMGAEAELPTLVLTCR